VLSRQAEVMLLCQQHRRKMESVDSNSIFLLF
jgi:hypothetical protein